MFTSHRLLGITIALLLCTPLALSAQLRRAKEDPNRGSDYGRWTVRPVVYPYYGLQDGYLDDGGEVVIDTEGRGLEGFLRFSRYRPGQHVSWGLDVGYSQQLQTLRHLTDASFPGTTLTTGSLVASPHVNISTRGVIRENHPYLTLGISNRYELDRSIRYNQDNTAQLLTDIRFLQRNSLYWMVGVGNIRERFSISRRNNTPIQLSILAFIPLFDKAQGVSSDMTSFNTLPLAESFRGLRRRSIHLGLMYTEILNIRGNRYNLKSSQVDSLAIAPSVIRPVQPLVSLMQPYHRFEGVLTLMGTHQAGVERIDSNSVSGSTTALRGTVGWRAAYTLHYNVNKNGYFGPRAKRLPGRSDRYLFQLFAALGITQQMYRFVADEGYGDLLRTTLSVEGGLSAGGPNSLMLFGGAGYRFSSNTTLLHGNELPLSLQAVQPLYGYIGIQIRSRFILRAETTPLEVLEGVRFKPVQRVNFGFGIGF